MRLVTGVWAREHMNGPSFATRQQSGKELRQSVPRSSHGDWAMREGGRDVIEILARSNEGRCA